MAYDLEKLRKQEEAAIAAMFPFTERAEGLSDEIESAERHLDYLEDCLRNLEGSEDFIDACRSLEEASEVRRRAEIQEKIDRIMAHGGEALAVKTFWDHRGKRVEKGRRIIVNKNIVAKLVKEGAITAP